MRSSPPESELPRALSLLPPDGWSFAWEYAGGQVPSISPDGQKVAFVAQDAEGSSALWVRSLDQPASRRLPGSEGAMHPFWSPDSRTVAFFKLNDSRHLYRIGIDGDEPRPITARGVDPATTRDGSWNGEGTLLLGGGFTGLMRVSATGGNVTVATQLDEHRADSTHRFPQFLPDSRRFIFLNITGSSESTGIYVGALDSEETTLVVVSQSAAVFVESGYLVYVRDGTLLAHPFDPDTLTSRASPMPPLTMSS